MLHGYLRDAVRAPQTAGDTVYLPLEAEWGAWHG